jgi:hypothetical protein
MSGVLDEEVVRRALRLGAEATVRIEAAGPSRVAPLEIEVRERRGLRRYIVRRFADSEAAANHAAVLEALQPLRLPFVPRIAGFAGEVPIEIDPEATPATGFALGVERWAEAVDALAHLHEVGIREGLRWERTPREVLPPAPPPLYRLGFAAHERAPAEPLFAAARELLADTPFGFVHGHPTAANVLFGGSGVAVVDYARAGFGAQLLDVAALIATSGLAAEERAALAERYGRRRGIAAARDLVDVAAIVWGVEELLLLPRRQVEVFGDDAATERLVTAARRIERALREPAGEHPLAAAIRSALWPA